MAAQKHGLRRSAATSPSFHTSQLDKLINLARANSLWYLLFGLACCGIELMQTGGPRADLERFGAVPRATPAPGRLHDRGRHAHLQDGRAARSSSTTRCPSPSTSSRWARCANCGGLFQLAYSVCKGVDKVIPVDVYVPGLPAAPRGAHRGAPPAPGDGRNERWPTSDERRPPRGRLAAAGGRTTRCSAADGARSRERPLAPTHQGRMTTSEIHERLKARFGDAVGPLSEPKVDPSLSVKATRLVEICALPQDDAGLEFDFLEDLTARRLAEARTSSRSSTTSSRYTHRHALRAQGRAPTAPTRSVADASRASGRRPNWLEREVFDLFGVDLHRPPRPAPHHAARRLGRATRCARTTRRRAATTASRTSARTRSSS